MDVALNIAGIEKYENMRVVIGQHFKPRYCRVSVELGRGKSLIYITVESMTSSIVIALDFLHTNKVYSSILMWISSILIRYRFTNKRHSRTMKTIQLPGLAVNNEL